MQAKFLNEEKTVISVEDAETGLIVVLDRGSPGFAELEEMGVEPFVPPDPVDLVVLERESMVVSRLQARAALLQAGLLDRVEKLVNGGVLMGGSASPLTRLAWNEATEFRRNSHTILALSKLVGLTDEQLDDLFRSAASLEF